MPLCAAGRVFTGTADTPQEVNFVLEQKYAHDCVFFHPDRTSDSRVIFTYMGENRGTVNIADGLPLVIDGITRKPNESKRDEVIHLDGQRTQVNVENEDHTLHLQVSLNPIERQG